MGRGEARAQLRHEVEFSRERGVGLFQEFTEGRAAQQLHHDEKAIGILADIEDRADVGM